MVVDLARPESYRQSLIAAFDSCPRRALFSLLDNRRTPGPLAASGTLWHRWVRAAIELMRENGETRLAVEIGMELLKEILAQQDVPPEEVVPITMRDMRWLRVLVAKWCMTTEISVKRIVGTERRFYADLELPTGVTRQITGQLDVLMADPPDGATVLDFKTGWQRPRQSKDQSPEATVSDDGKGLTELGWVQSLVYSHLIFANFASVAKVTFREYHVRWGETRQTTMYRWESERMTDVLAAQVALLDLAVEAGPGSPRWTESAGPHCALCARPRECPIQRTVGIPASLEDARRITNEWIVAGVVRSERMGVIKGWISEHGPIEIQHAKGRRLVGWSEDKKTFGIYEPKPDESPYDAMLEQAVREAEELRGV